MKYLTNVQHIERRQKKVKRMLIQYSTCIGKQVFVKVNKAKNANNAEQRTTLLIV